jgi:hypothetical protein
MLLLIAAELDTRLRLQQSTRRLAVIMHRIWVDGTGFRD